uniref:Uncharacterized protein n=1 Tax=viral metagenome TaxID=1070528 RepID=A0A6C0H8V1_9ZZZZ
MQYIEDPILINDKQTICVKLRLKPLLYNIIFFF